MKIMISLLFLIVTVTVSHAQSLEEKTSQQKKWETRNSRYDNSVYSDQGGYTSDSEIVSSRSLFREAKFTVEDFSRWTLLFHESTAISLFDDWVKTGHLAKDGEVVKPVPNPSITTKVGHILQLKDLQKNISHSFTDQQLINLLKKENILNSEGFVTGLKTTSNTAFQDIDFSLVYEKIQQLKLPIKHKKLESALKKDLYKLIESKHKITEVTQLETTHYQSRNDVFWKQIGEQVLGTILGKWLFPNKQSINTFENEWVKDLSLANHFPSYKYGFNHAPYHRRGQGWLVLNGQDTATTIDADTLSNDISRAYQTNVQYHAMVNPGHLNTPTSTLFTLGLSADVIQGEASDDDLLHIAPKVGLQALGEHSKFSSDLGLSFRSGSGASTSIGLLWGVGLQLYPVNPISLKVDYRSHSQVSFKNEVTNWELNQFELGIGGHYKQVSLDTGYRWLSSGDVDIVEGWFYGVRVYF